MAYSPGSCVCAVPLAEMIFRSVARPSPRRTPRTPLHRFLLRLEGAALAIPGGVVDAAKDLYSLADTIAGDPLPDWKPSPFGESESTARGLIEGAANFAVGFAPAAGWLGKGAGLSSDCGCPRFGRSSMCRGCQRASSFRSRIRFVDSSNHPPVTSPRHKVL